MKFRQDNFGVENDEDMEEQMYEAIRDAVGQVKSNMNLAFKLDGIIFAELLTENVIKPFEEQII